MLSDGEEVIVNDSKSENPRHVIEIGVLGLFNLYDHTVKLNQQERITILHGPNGVGKTVFLEMIRDFRKGNLEKFRVTPFREFFVRYSDGKTSYVRPHKYASSSHTLEVVLDDDFDKVISVTNQSGVQRALRSELSDGHVYFIGVDRLAAKQKKQKNNQVKTISRLDYCSEQLKEHMKNALTNYAQVAQKLDQSFPHRLLSTNAFAGSVDDLKAAFSLIANQRQRYQSIGVLGGTEASSPFDTSELEKLDASRYATLSLYVEDTQQKLDVLEPLVKRLEILLGIINSRFQNKVLSISADEGLQFHDTFAKDMALSVLSSGERQLLIVFYELLFSTSSNALVLVDEPELSWHISWQKRFISDLKDISQLVGFDALVATHSPYIVEGHSGLMVPLNVGPVVQQEAA